MLARHWIEWAGAVALTFGLTLGVALLVGLPQTVRRTVLARYKAMGRAILP